MKTPRKNKITDIDKAYEEARRADNAYKFKRKSGGWFTEAIEREPAHKQKEQRMKEYRAEARRLVSLANKRIKRLEERNLTDTPAYKALVEKNGNEPRFSVKGKDFNELQSMVGQINKFVKAKTSTVRGTVAVVKNMADITNFKYESVTQLKNSMGKFFELASLVQQYLRNTQDIASAIGYQKIWEAVNEYLEVEKIDLSDSEQSIDGLIEIIADAIVEKEASISMTSNPAPDGTTYTADFKLLD